MVGRERDVKRRAIDRPEDHAHPGERGALMFQVKIERRPGQTRPAAASRLPQTTHALPSSYIPTSPLYSLPLYSLLTKYGKTMLD